MEAKQRELWKCVPGEVRNKPSVVETVRRGNPEEEVLLAASDQSADLSVLGTQPRSFLDLAFWGTTAERVLRHPEEAVLVIPWEEETST
jgi:nucleotide-binding universal stress UspA family protein